MLVILFVTGNAIHGRTPENRAFVTGLALDVVVFSKQWKTGPAMVESSLIPVAFDVAIVAFLAQRAFVLVILLVAGHARGLELVSIQAPGMATVTAGLSMFAPQHIFRVSVVIE